MTEANHIRKLLMLTSSERKTLIVASFLLPLTGVMVRLFGVQWTKEKLTPERMQPGGAGANGGVGPGL